MLVMLPSPKSQKRLVIAPVEMSVKLTSNGAIPSVDPRLLSRLQWVSMKVGMPPSQMVASMSAGQMDGFCVGEPWNNRAILDKIGFTAVTTQQMWRDHPEKVCAFTEEFAAKNPKTAGAAHRCRGGRA